MQFVAAAALAVVGAWYFTLDQKISGVFLMLAAATTILLALRQYRGDPQ